MSDLIGTVEAAVLLGVGERQVRYLIGAGQLVGTLVAGRHVLHRADVEKLARRRDRRRRR